MEYAYNASHDITFLTLKLVRRLAPFARITITNRVIV